MYDSLDRPVLFYLQKVCYVYECTRTCNHKNHLNEAILITHTILTFMENLESILITPDRWQSKKLIFTTNVDQKSLEIVFSIAICRQSVDKCQSKTLFLTIFDLRSSIVNSFFDCCLSVVII